MTNPSNPNYKPNVGRLVADRFDFQHHIEGSNFRHKADSIDLSPSLVVGGNTVTNLQSAVTAINVLVGSTPIQLATATTPGMVQLSTTGDVQGTATKLRVVNIQGVPINTLTPTNGQVLTFSGGSWSPSAGFSGSGDLAGTSSSQTVIGLTGVSNTVSMHGNTIIWDAIKSPFLTQFAASSGINGANFLISAQTGNNANGGTVSIQGGNTSGSHLIGGVSLKGGDTSFGLQYTNVNLNKRVLSMLTATTLTSTNMPSNTGDLVMFVGDAATIPAAAALPVGGTIMYSSSGKMNITQGDGINFTIGSPPNPELSGLVGTLTIVDPPTLISAVEYKWKGVYQSTAATPKIIEFVGIPNTSALVKATLVGTSGTTPGNAACFNLTLGFTVSGVGVLALIGTTTSTDPRNTAGASGWTVPTITNASNKMRVTTGFSGSETIDWSVVVTIVSSK